MMKLIKGLQKRMKNQKGFTLIELIVVIAILGILAGIAVPKFGDVTKKAEETANKATARTIAAAVMMYRASSGEMESNPGIDDLGSYLEDIEGLEKNKWEIKYGPDGDDSTSEIYSIKKDTTTYYPSAD